jgi:RNA polymerase sigma factor (sigma-70 family)
MKQANVFRKKYYLKNSYVSNSELLQSCLLGLVKSMKYYDGRVSVPSYANKYIQGELYKTFTRKHIGGRFTHYELMHKKKKASKHTQVELYQQHKPYTVVINSKIGMKYYDTKSFIIYIHEFLNTLRPIDRYIFLLRYDIYTGKIVNRYKDIGQLTCLSRASIHKSLQQTRRNFALYDKLQHIYTSSI